jgi:hypothetical protein
MRRLLKWLAYAFVGLVLLVVLAAVLAPSEPPSVAENPPDDSKAGAKEEPKPQPDVLRVTGTAGIPFSCAVMHGDMRQTTVDGTVPMDIKLENMDDFAATSENSCQKTGARGLLKIEMVIDGKVVNSNETSAQYGVATVGNS